MVLAMKAYDAQFFARCHKVDLRTAKRAARAMDMELSEFIRRAVNEKATRVASTEDAYPGAYRSKETVA